MKMIIVQSRRPGVKEWGTRNALHDLNFYGNEEKCRDTALKHIMAWERLEPQTEFRIATVDKSYFGKNI